MTAAPRISVVLIVRDGERFLDEAIDSVVAQTYPDWELVAVDDGSIDGTAGILARRAAALGGRMLVARHAGGGSRGMSAARNLGIRESRGEYVTFLDHDDVLLPEKLAKHVAALDDDPDAAAAIGPNLRWHSWSDPSREDEVQDLGVPVGVRLPPPGPLPVFLARSRSVPLGITVRRTALDDVGGFEDAFTGMYEDQVLQSKLCLRHPVRVVGTVQHRYRQHPASCVRRTFGSGTQLLARRRFLRWLREYLRTHAPDEADLQALVRRELARTRLARWHWMLRQARLGVARIVKGRR